MIEAVGVDAQSADGKDREELKTIAPKTNPDGGNWVPGNAPIQSLDWAVQAVAKAGTIGIVGVFPEQVRVFPIGKAMNRNLTINMGNCNHRNYIPKLVELVRGGAVDPLGVLTVREPMVDAIAAYKEFDKRTHGRTKVELVPRG